MKLFHVLFVAIFVSCIPKGFATTLTLEQYRSAMERLVKHLPETLDVSFHAEVLGTGQELFSQGSDKLLVPASNAKLISSIVALERLGPSFKMMNRIYAEGTVSNGVLAGNLVVRGEGDAFLVSERLWLLARAVARSGIKKITGGIKVDNSYFSEDYRGLVGWSEAGEPFAAIVSATSLNFNSLEVHVIPDDKATRPRVELGPIPHRYANLRNELRYVNGSSRAVGVRPAGMKDGKEDFAIVGTVGRSANPFVTYGTVSEPGHYLAAVLGQMLRSEGVEVAKGYQGVTTQPSSHPIALQESAPLLDLTRSINTYSNNFMAEQVFQVLGAVVGGKPASIEQSRKVAKEYLDGIPDCKNVILANGSGLSWESQANAKCFTALLQHVYRDFLVFADLIGSMPVGGATGTLRDRFKRTGPDFSAQKVRAKTGTLFSRRAVTSLVGFTPAKNGETVVFAIVQNDKRADSSLISAMRDWEDRCVELLQQLQL